MRINDLELSETRKAAISHKVENEISSLMIFDLHATKTPP